jgi:hypothetical protein
LGVNREVPLYMSTSRGKPLNPINLSTRVSHKAREGAVTERHLPEDDNGLPRSPYAPKRAHRRAGTEWHPADDDRDPLRSPYAPAKERAQPAVTSDFAAGDATAPRPPVRAPGSLREHIERHAVGADESHLRSHDAVHPNMGRHEQPAAEHRDETMSDRDLERLEAILRRLQRQESATRLPRATNRAPVSGLAPPSGHRQSGERFGDGFRAPRSLERQRLPPPLEMPRRTIGAPVGIVVAIILVATIAYYFAVGGWAPPSEPAPAPQTASSDPPVVAPPQHDDRATSPQSEISSQHSKASQPARSSEGETVATLQPAEPGAQLPPASKATRALDPEEIKLLMKQGEQVIAAGDVVTARIVFQRAAEAGDADAAVVLGATYDPIVLAKLGVTGLGADVDKARTWYQKAESLGSVEATRRLAILANRNFAPMPSPMR